MSTQRLPKPTNESLMRDFPDDLERTIALAITSFRHIHAANYPCTGCITRAAKAVRSNFIVDKRRETGTPTQGEAPPPPPSSNAPFYGKESSP